MPKQTIRLKNILGGISNARMFVAEGQYSYGVGIDPFAPMSDAAGDKKPSGVMRPTAFEDFSSAELTDSPMWLLTNPKNTNVYAYLANGKIVSYNSALGSETHVGTPTSGAGNGGAYYNNYLYFATPTDISRYGPLDGSPSLTNTFWTSSLSQTALRNWTSPTLRNEKLPNHVMHVHGDNKLYIADFDTSGTGDNRGKGLIHYIKTKYGSAEGDTDDGSAYAALDLPLGFKPVAMASLGVDLVIAAIQTESTSIRQGKAKLFLWDTVSDSFYQEFEIDDPLITAMKGVGGAVYIWSGDSVNGFRVSILTSGGLQAGKLYPMGLPPYAGAVDFVNDRLLWGGFTQIPTTTPASPEYFACLYAMGAPGNELPSGMHVIGKSTASGTSSDGVVTSILAAEQDGLDYPKVIMGHRDAGGFGIDKQSTTYGESVLHYPFFVGRAFRVIRVRIPLSEDIAANMVITPKLFVDDYKSSQTLRTINNTNWTLSERFVNLYPDVNGKNDGTLELRWSGSALIAALNEILIDIEVYED